jgi:hypothetical protein
MGLRLFSFVGSEVEAGRLNLQAHLSVWRLFAVCEYETAEEYSPLLNLYAGTAFSVPCTTNRMTSRFALSLTIPHNQLGW